MPAYIFWKNSNIIFIFAGKVSGIYEDLAYE